MGAYRAVAAGLLILIAAAATADDCSSFRLVSSRASSPNLVNGPMAFSGTVTAVARTQEGTPGAVWLGFYGNNLETLAADRLVATTARQVYGLAWTGTEFALLYRTDTPALLLQRLSTFGDPIGGPIQVTPGRTVYSSDEVDFAWSAALDAFVVARVVSQGAAKGLWITVLEENGTQRSDRLVPVLISPQSQLALAVTNTGIIGAFFINVNDNLVFARLGPAGAADARVLSTAAGTNLAVAAHQELFVVTRAVEGVDRTNIRWLVVDTAHQLVRPDAVLVEAPGDQVFPLALVSNGSDLALSYVDSPEATGSLDDVFRLLRFTSNGTILSDTRFSDDVAVSRASTQWPFVWTGFSYVAAPVRSSSDRLNSYLVKYCPLRVDLGGPRSFPVGSVIEFRPTTLGGVGPYQYVWQFSNETRTDRGEVQVRAYPVPGTYTATVTVTDSEGASSSTTVMFEIFTPEPPPKPRRRGVRS